MAVYLCQQNVSLLEAEEKTMEQLAIEDNTQILIEGRYYTAITTKNLLLFAFCLMANNSNARLYPQKLLPEDTQSLSVPHKSVAWSPSRPELEAVSRRPRNRWLDQLRRDNNTHPADLWR